MYLEVSNTTIIAAFLLLIILIFVIVTYNSLIHLKQKVKEAWSDIEVQLKRRTDLIPNLVKTVKEYARHEEALLTHLTELRTHALESKDMIQKAAVEKEVETTLKHLFAVAEGYPELKANENFLKLQEELVETEDQIASARRIYNSNVSYFNTKVSIFPSNIVALFLGFKLMDFFQNE